MGKLGVRAWFDSPVREASGLCVTRVSGSESLAVVGDRDTTIAWCRLDPDLEEWETVELASLAGAPDDLGQLEAVGDAGDGKVLVMAEEPAVVVHVDLDRREIVGSWHIAVDADQSLRKMWDRDPNSRGEGLVVGPDQHLLVVKEKKPVLVVEVGPPGAEPVMQGKRPTTSRWRGPAKSELVPLAWDEVQGAPSDVSDAVVIDERLYLLSDQERRLVECSHEAGRWVAGASFELDSSIEKPEGIAVTADGRLFVAMDLRKGVRAIAEIDPPQH